MSAVAEDPRESTLPFFVQAVSRYFHEIAGLKVEIESPYLLDGAPPISDFTAVIGVSGDLQGCVYYSAPRGMLDALLRFAGEDQPTDDLRCDMVGEAANTLSGNVRRQLGSGFMISVPVVLQGRPERLTWPKNTACFVIPIQWKECRSLLMLCLAENPTASSDL